MTLLLVYENSVGSFDDLIPKQSYSGFLLRKTLVHKMLGKSELESM